MDFLWMWLFMLVAATGFVSCSEEDDEGGAGNVPKELLGSWNVYGTETITFNANGTLVWDYGDGDVENYSYFYDEKNETITISGYGESVKWKIISLTDSKLVLADDEGDEMTFTKVGAPDDEGDEGTPGPAYDTSEPVDLPELQYEDISGKYAVNESESGYAFVELTAAGQYFIVPTNSPYLKKAPKKKSQRKPFLAGEKQTSVA